MKKFGLLIMTIITAWLALSAQPASAVELSPADEAVLRQMPLRKKLGQMFLIGFMGKKIDEGLGETIANVSPGGIIVFGRNIDSAPQLSEMLYQAQLTSLKTTKTPLLIGTDQEGGDVIRINTAMPLPSALAFGRNGNTELTETAGFATGQLLRTLGFNMNLAPVLDVADPEKPAFIGTRTYGVDPEVVAQNGVAFANGLKRAGVLPTGKHFPGHGGVIVDSHVSMPEKTQSLEELERMDLIPFRALTNAFGDKSAVMLAHVSYPSLDKTKAAATFSKPIVTGILRNGMKFDGLVLTDDISMAGAGQIRNVRERAVRTIEAGADMVMVAWNRRLQGELLNALEAAVRSGRIKMDRIDASVRRVLAAKRAYAAATPVRASQDALRLAVKNAKFGEIGEEILRGRLVREPDSEELAFRAFADNRQVLVFSANTRFAQSFKDAARSRTVKLWPMNINQPPDVTKIMRAHPQAVGVFYVSGVQAAKIASRIGEDVARRMLLVTIEAQGIMPNAQTFRYIADVYYRHPQLGKMVANQYFPDPAQVRQPASVRRKVKTVGLSTQLSPRSSEY